MFDICNAPRSNSTSTPESVTDQPRAAATPMETSQVLEHLPFCVCVLDSTNAIITANSKFSALIDPKKIKGIDIVTALVEKAQQKDVTEAINEVRATSESRYRKHIDTLVLCEGMPIYRRFDWVIGSWPDVEGAVALYGTMTTVVDDEKLEKEAEFVDFFENAPIALHWLSDTGHVLWANKTEMRVLGYTEEEYIGQNIMKFCPDEEALVLEIFKSLGSGNTIKDVPVRFRTKAGKIHHLLIDSNVNYKVDGSFNHTRCFIRDDTARKIKDARSGVVLKEAKRSLGQMDEFICKAFHNIRTPCHILLQLLGSLKDVLEDSPNPEGREELTMATRAAVGLMNVLDDAADASRFERGLTVAINTVPVRLDELAYSVIEHLQHIQYTVKEGVEVKIELKGNGSKAVLGDYKLLHRILFHLVENAVKATSEGEIKLCIETPENGLCRFKVSDTGKGIPGGADAVRAVFQRYWQYPVHAADPLVVDAAAETEVVVRDALDESLGLSSGCEGLGLGLNVAFNLVQAMGGVLNVVSTEKSTSFDFVLELPPVGEPPYVGLQDVIFTKEAVEKLEASKPWTAKDKEYDWQNEDLTSTSSAVDFPHRRHDDDDDTTSEADTDSVSDPGSSVDVKSSDRDPDCCSPAQLVSEGVFEVDRAVHILIVEDNTMCQRVVTKQLTMLGCTVEVAEHGGIALEKLRGTIPGYFDLILMDLRMPVMDGFQCTRIIRGEMGLKTTVLALSGETGQVEGKNVEDLCEEIGFNGFIAKPCGKKKLQVALKEHLPKCLLEKLAVH